MLRVFDRGLEVVSWLAAALVVVLLFAGPSLIGAKRSTVVVKSSGQGGTAQPSGAAVFANAGCARCHTLKAAGASGAIGPNLDELRPTAAVVSQTVKAGAGGMPSFSGKLSDAEIAAVASYVASVAGR
jgi:mono/diheme cytochrome c family protein